MESNMKKIELIIKTLPYNQLLEAKELYLTYFLDMEEATFYKNLERLMEKKSLARLSKGIYYRPKETKFGMVPITQEKIIEHYTNDFKGIITGYQLFVEKGLTTQIPKHIEVLSTNLSGNIKHINDVKVSKIWLALNKETIPTIEAFEILQHYSKIEDINHKRFFEYFQGFSKEYKESVTEYVIENRKYKKSTIAFLAHLLNYFDVKNNLNKHLSSLSNYKIPLVEEYYEFT